MKIKVNTAVVSLATLILLIVLGLGGLAVVGIGYFGLKNVAETRTPLRAATVELRSVPPKEPICPGGKFEYIFKVQQLRTPIIIRIVKTVVSPEEAKTIIPQKAGDVELRIWTSLAGFTQRDFFVLPKRDKDGRKIEPGTYYFRLGVVAEGSAPSVFQLEFKVPEGCPD